MIKKRKNILIQSSFSVIIKSKQFNVKSEVVSAKHVWVFCQFMTYTAQTRKIEGKKQILTPIFIHFFFFSHSRWAGWSFAKVHTI